jgi:uncharacterized membrane protein YhhN
LNDIVTLAHGPYFQGAEWAFTIIALFAFRPLIYLLLARCFIQRPHHVSRPWHRIGALISIRLLPDLLILTPLINLFDPISLVAFFLITPLLILPLAGSLILGLKGQRLGGWTVTSLMVDPPIYFTCFVVIVSGIDDGFAKIIALACAVAMLGLLAITATMLSRDPKAQDPLAPTCTTCGYNLTGITTATCPECGKQDAPPAS